MEEKHFNIEVGYYQINNTKKVLYWNGEEWQKPIKDSRGGFGSYVTKLDKQPKIKTTTPIEETEYKSLYKIW